MTNTELRRLAGAVQTVANTLLAFSNYAIVIANIIEQDSRLPALGCGCHCHTGSDVYYYHFDVTPICCKALNL